MKTKHTESKRTVAQVFVVCEPRSRVIRLLLHPAQVSRWTFFIFLPGTTKQEIGQIVCKKKSHFLRYLFLPGIPAGPRWLNSPPGISSVGFIFCQGGHHRVTWTGRIASAG